MGYDHYERRAKALLFLWTVICGYVKIYGMIHLQFTDKTVRKVLRFGNRDRGKGEGNMRGTIKDDTYFAEKLQKNGADIEHYEALVEKVVAERGESDRGAQMGYAVLFTSYRNRINLLYSTGNKDSEIKPCFENLLKYYVKTWEPRYSYFDLINVLSLAVLLDVKADNELVNELIGKIRKADYQDYLVDQLAGALDTSYEPRCPEFRWKKTYQPLKEIAENAAVNAVDLLKQYLDDQWYGIHKECAWYGSHKTELYYGYWSFEAGAIAKLLGLDDTSLRDQKYYPYDLVHGE